MDQTFATGLNLVTKYQAVYGLGALLGDGTLESKGSLINDGTMLSDGVLLSDSLITSNGITLSDGSIFLSCGVLLGNGALLGDGTLLSDGTLLGDGSMMTDGVLLSDVCIQATQAMIQGDDTASMGRVLEASLPPKAPGELTAVAASKSQINLAWSDNSLDESGFKVERSTDGLTFAQVATAGAGVKTYASAGLSGGKKYYYRVSAYNANGSSTYTSVAAATTPTK
jgi:hypothetical protein